MYINLCHSQDNLHSHHPPKFPFALWKKTEKAVREEGRMTILCCPEIWKKKGLISCGRYLLLGEVI